MNVGNEVSASHILSLKEKGNKHYTAKQYEEALNEYTLAIDEVEKGIESLLEKGELAMRDISALYSNRAATLLSLKKPLQALEDAQSCCSLEPTWSKGHVRLGDANFALARHEMAKHCYQLGLHHDPANSFCKKGIEKCHAVITNKELSDYYNEELLSNGECCCQGVKIKFVNQAVGKGAFATRNFTKGELILVESPLVCNQSRQSRLLHSLCYNCKRFVGSPRAQLSQLLHDEVSWQSDNYQLPELDLRYPRCPDPVDCSGCGEAFCSVVCHQRYCDSICLQSRCFSFIERPFKLDQAHCQYQQLFCNRGVLQEEYQVTAQEKLKKTITSTSQRLGLCVQLVAIILCKAAAILGKAGSNHLKSCPKECQYCHSDETNSSNFEKLVTLKGEEQATAALQMVMEEYSHTCRESCIDIFSRNIHRDDIEKDPQSYVRQVQEVKELQRAISTVSDALRIMWPSHFALFPTVFETAFLERLYGMFVLNNCHIVISHPFRQYVANFRFVPKDQQGEVQALLQPLLEKLHEKFHGDIDAGGEGFFRVHSAFNHSCDPNVQQVQPSLQAPSPSAPQPHPRTGLDLIGNSRAGVRLEAIRDIKKGEELYISYITVDGKNVTERRQELQLSHRFCCSCKKCTTESS